MRQDCGETLVRPYHPHFQEALQQDVEVKVVIGAEHLEPEIPSDLGPGSGWKQISLLNFLHGIYKFKEPASQSTVLVVASRHHQDNISYLHPTLPYKAISVSRCHSKKTAHFSFLPPPGSS